MKIRITHIDIPTPRVNTPANRAAIGFFLEQQVKRRFQTQGLSGGARWARKKRQDSRAILTGRTAVLLNSFFHALFGSRGVAVGSAVRYAKVHQLGTKGKGGKLPTIVPKRAKALWIPLNDKAARVGPRGRGLKYGKDFVFAKKIDIPPRPMLPDSPAEIAEQQEFVGSLVSL